MEKSDTIIPGGDTQLPGGPSESEKGTVKGKVDYDTYRKTVDQLKSLKQKNQDYEQILSSIEVEKKVKEEQELMKKQEFEKLLERRNAEIEAERKARLEIETRLKQSEQNRIDSLKLGAFYEKLGGKIKRKEYLSFVDLDQIEFDEQSGKINEDTVMKTVNQFMVDHHHLVDTKTKTMPNEAPSSYNGKITYDQWMKLPLKDKKKYSPKDIMN